MTVQWWQLASLLFCAACWGYTLGMTSAAIIEGHRTLARREATISLLCAAGVAGNLIGILLL